MGNSRRKGFRGEHEWATKVGGSKISRTGYDGPDVESPPMSVDGLVLWEVKRVKALPKWLDGWLVQARAEGADALAFRQDRDEWWVLVPAHRLEEPT